MKRITSLFVATIVALPLFAQYHIGDLYEYEGVPAIVVSVDDESGEHGTVITFAPSKFFCSVRDSLGITEEMIIEKPFKYFLKISPKAAKLLSIHEKGQISNYIEVAPSLTGSGEANSAVIRKFCEDKGLNIEDAFPEQAWALSLGEGWYYVGDDEISLYASLLSPGLGQKIKVSGAKDEILNNFKALNEKCQGTDGFSSIMPPLDMLHSSTMTLDGKKINRHYLWHYVMASTSVKTYLDIATAKMGELLVRCPSYAACHKF